jgi:catechol 2,3-dioxygenase-like lactoylglutathione lyase family enzyme
MIHFLLNRAARNASIRALLLSATIVGAQTPPRPHILGVAHIAVFAHDYEKSRSFYGGFLGFEEPYSLKNKDGSASMTFFKINDHQYIELFPEREPNSDRLNHISLETDDIEALRVYLASKGIKVPDHAQQARIGNLSFNIIDPAGHQVEMVQYMPAGKTVAAYGKYISDTRVSAHMTHVGLIVTQLDPEYKFYTEILGFKETGEAVHREPSSPGSISIETRLGINRKRQANLFDPDGTRTELMEPHTIDGKPTPSSTAPPPG